jgi:glycosyltransferase involved in cell wall biosynthesis
MSIAERIAPDWAMFRFGWDSYRRADACVAGTEWEAYLMRTMFRVPEGRLHVVPNGVERVFLESAAVPRGPWLVCTATLTERKRVLELAEAAVQAQTPVWIIGKSYGEADPYVQRFQHFARQHSALVRYEGAIGDRAQLARIYREARGFVLLSTIETRSLSAEEAAACGCPLLLSDLPWAQSVYGEHARYCPITRSAAKTARVLREFYQAAPSLPPPPRPLGWFEVGKQFASIYASVLSKS